MPVSLARTQDPAGPAPVGMPVPFSCSRHLLAHGIVRVAVAGELDLVTVPELDEMLRCAPDEAELIMLDLGAVEFMDSSGAHLLVTADRRMSQAGRRLVVSARPLRCGGCSSSPASTSSSWHPRLGSLRARRRDLCQTSVPSASAGGSRSGQPISLRVTGARTNVWIVTRERRSMRLLCPATVRPPARSTAALSASDRRRCTPPRAACTLSW